MTDYGTFLPPRCLPTPGKAPHCAGPHTALSDPERISGAPIARQFDLAADCSRAG
jgi:hypothetical protein